MTKPQQEQGNEAGISLLAQANALNFEGVEKRDGAKLAEALRLYDQLLTQNPKHAELLATVATVHLRNPETLGHSVMMFEHCVDEFKNAGKKVPTEVYSNLGLAYKNSGQAKKAEAAMKKAIDAEPSAGTLSNYGSLFVETDRVQEGQKALERSIKLDPSLSMAHWNLSLCLLAQANETGEWGRAWDEYEYGQHEGGMRVVKKLVPLPDWDGTKGKKVLVYGEQGIGDEIMFASMLPDLMKDCSEVIIDSHPRLTTLFSKAFGLKCYGTRKQPELDWLEVEKPDYKIAMGSLGKFYRRNAKDFPRTPYLKAEPLLPRGRKLRVGISWTGGRLRQRVARRTVPLNWWRDILANDCEFVSLQYTPGAADEIKNVRDTLGFSIKEFAQVVEKGKYDGPVDTPEQAEKARQSGEGFDYYETAALVASCDLVITVCTSIVHLAGALGVPCWVMVPKSPAWRYQNIGPMPWYGSVRLYRSPANEDAAWIPVIKRIDEDLLSLIKEREKGNVAGPTWGDVRIELPEGQGSVAWLPGPRAETGAGRTVVRQETVKIPQAQGQTYKGRIAVS